MLPRLPANRFMASCISERYAGGNRQHHHEDARAVDHGLGIAGGTRSWGWCLYPVLRRGTVANSRAYWAIAAVHTHLGVGLQAVARLMFLHLIEGIGAVRFAIAADEVICAIEWC